MSGPQKSDFEAQEQQHKYADCGKVTDDLRGYMRIEPPSTRDLLTAIEALSVQLTRLEGKVDRLMALDATTQTSLDNLNAAVAQQTTVESSVETLLTGLSAQIATLKTGQTDPAVIAAIDAAAGIVSANNAKAQAAVVANTPAS